MSVIVATAFDTLIRRSSRPSASPESTAWTARCSPSLRSVGLAGDHQGGRGIEQRHVAKRGMRAFENVHAAPWRLLPHRHRAEFRLDPVQADLFGRYLEACHRAILERRDAGRPGGRDLVEPIRAVHHPDVLGAEILQDQRQRLRPVSENTPTICRRTPAGLDSGPSRLKIVRVPSSTRVAATFFIAG